jgi:hypothetical protein
MYNIAARKAWVDEIKSLSDVPKQRILPWQQPSWPTATGVGQVDYVSPSGKTYSF